jgi:hypothetical protein
MFPADAVSTVHSTSELLIHAECDPTLHVSNGD